MFGYRSRKGWFWGSYGGRIGNTIAVTLIFERLRTMNRVVFSGARCVAFLDSSQLARTAQDIIRQNGAVEMSELRKLRRNPWRS